MRVIGYCFTLLWESCTQCLVSCRVCVVGNESKVEARENLYSDVYAMVREIPEGQVATYGQIARLISRPRYSRHIGYALAALPEEHDVPWHRVVNARGEISSRAKAGYEDYQRILLEEEGVEFSLNGRIILSAFQWSA